MTATGEGASPAGLAPVKEGIFRFAPSADGPHWLLGSKCRACGEIFFPPRTMCLNCTSRDMEPVEFGRQGVIWTFTVVRQKPPGYLGTVPYGLAIVETSEQVRVSTYLTSCDVESLRVGMPVELVPAVFQDEAGNEVQGYAYRPANPEERR